MFGSILKTLFLFFVLVANFFKLEFYEFILFYIKNTSACKFSHLNFKVILKDLH